MIPARRSRLRLVFLAVLIAAVVVFAVYFANNADGSVGYKPHGPPQSLAELGVVTEVEVVPDPRPAFTLEPTQPWKIDLGRGSGWHGLDTVALAHDGRVVLHQAKWEREGTANRQRRESAELTLPPDAIRHITDSVVAERLLDLGREYHAKGVADGTQWVLWVRQGGREKAVYLDNHFPEAAVQFAATVDAELTAAGAGLRWRNVFGWDERGHERELWASIRR